MTLELRVWPESQLN